MSDFNRRLPIYLLLDCSGSMWGEPIEAVKQGVKALVAELKGDPQALETAYLSVITFDSVARQVTPLTELMQFCEPELTAGGTTALGDALRLLMQCVNTEVRRTTQTQKGDWRPLAFLLTDGSPTDEWAEAAEALRTSGFVSLIACAAGAMADTKSLKQITDDVILMNTLSAGDLARFFTWVSGSIRHSSKRMEAYPGQSIELPPPPEGFVIVS